MKNYLITKELLNELLYGNIPNKEILSSALEELLQKNETFFISINSLNQTLEAEVNLEKRKLILQNINSLCSKLIITHPEDLNLALGFETEFNISHYHALELTLAQKTNIDYILDITDNFKFQKMISVINLIFKSK